jgi:hypothetical protein
MQKKWSEIDKWGIVFGYQGQNVHPHLSVEKFCGTVDMIWFLRDGPTWLVTEGDCPPGDKLFWCSAVLLSCWLILIDLYMYAPTCPSPCLKKGSPALYFSLIITHRSPSSSFHRPLSDKSQSSWHLTNCPAQSSDQIGYLQSKQSQTIMHYLQSSEPYRFE